MITVNVKRHADHTVAEVTIDGHAGFANPGEDIVCAAVSGISFGMLNAIEMLLKTPLAVTQGEDGYLRCAVPQEYPEELREKVQLLLEGMIASLKSVALEYGSFVKVNDKKKR
ncbi:ribosomal-processing cysteine protease Prp [Aneurinibacillus terranovensis]|uniref:ribosomal-processing cysteine protease Prp n=1 Tax=Aneurinibacillus terranovensis TaxID=278991 RepID=UPI000402A282|nr:ribosomal-processing cysteine protease Prp [Aneurinibacillus terranovensis]